MSQDTIIHIGWHKSASTFLQQGLFQAIGANFQPLAKFPDGFDAATAKFGSLIDFVESPDQFDPALLRNALQGNGAENLTLISQEEISGHSHGYSLINPVVTARNLAATFPNARIIAIIRNQFDYLLSLYCYRVAVRGHEYRSLRRFVTEDIRDGLDKHLQYDRLIGEYVRLYGKEHVLVLPVEMLRLDPNEFIKRITTFIGRTPEKPITLKSSNESTRQAMTIAIWRPLNFIFSMGLSVALLLTGKRLADGDPHHKKIHPFLPMRYRYYTLKRKTTGWLARRFPNGRKVGVDDVPFRDSLGQTWADSNARLKALGVIDWEMERFGYAENVPTHSS